jgi:ribosomal protein S27E
MSIFVQVTYGSICEVLLAGHRDILHRLRNIVFQDAVPNSVPDPTEARWKLLLEKVGGYFVSLLYVRCRLSEVWYDEGSFYVNFCRLCGGLLVKPTRLLIPYDVQFFIFMC